MMKRRPLLGMSFGILISIVLIAIVPITIFNLKSFRQFFFQETEAYLKESCTVMKNLFPYDAENRIGGKASGFASRAAAGTGLRITITAEDGTVIADSHGNPGGMNNHADRPEIAAAISKGYGSSVRTSATLSVAMMYSAVRLDYSGGRATLRIARSLEDLETSIRTITGSSILICAVMLIAAGWLSFILAGRVSDLLNKISNTSRHYASGRFDEKCQIVSPKELAGIADDLNLMGQQLNERFRTIEAQKNELQLMLDNMSDAVIFTDRALHVIRMNGAAEQLFELDGKNEEGKSIIELFMNSRLEEFAEMLIHEKKPLIEEIIIEKPKTVHLEVSGTVLLDSEDDDINSVLLVMHDITKNRQLEQMRKDFVANVSHELKTPVTLIKGYIETMLDARPGSPAGTPEKTREFLAIMEKHSLRIEAIINDLLTLSGIEKGDGTELTKDSVPAVNLLESAASTCQPAADEKNIMLHTECDESIMLEVYPLMAEQALINLIDNAVKYSPENTTVYAEAYQSETDGRICFAVRDQGCGISKTDQLRIFERFYRVDKARSRESGGTGLGLSIVRHIALVHGGEIKVDSRKGRGSKFTLCL